MSAFFLNTLLGLRGRILTATLSAVAALFTWLLTTYAIAVPEAVQGYVIALAAALVGWAFDALASWMNAKGVAEIQTNLNTARLLADIPVDGSAGPVTAAAALSAASKTNLYKGIIDARRGQ